MILHLADVISVPNFILIRSGGFNSVGVEFLAFPWKRSRR